MAPRKKKTDPSPDAPPPAETLPAPASLGEFSVPRVVFSKALDLAASIIPAKATTPILANVMLVAESGAIMVAVTDGMSRTARQTIPCEVRAPARMLLGGTYLARIVRGMPSDDPVSVTVQPSADPTGVPVQATVKQGRRKYEVPILPVDDYPTTDIHAGEPVQFDVGALRAIMDRAEFSVGGDERAHLAGIRFELGAEESTAIATSGHSLARIAAPPVPGVSWAFTLPTSALSTLRAMLPKTGTVGLSFAGSTIAFSVEGVTYATQAIAGDYPAWRGVVPSKHKWRVVAERTLLLSVAKALAETGDVVDLFPVEGGMGLHVHSPDLGDADDAIPCETEGEQVKMRVRAKLFIGALDACSTDQVALEGEGELDPFILRAVGGPDDLWIVMPTRES